MSKATRKSTPRMRKKHFSDKELNMLVNMLAGHADEVFANNLKREAQMRKKQIWEEVARKVTVVGNTTRMVNDCKKRWDDLLLRVRNILAANHREAMATGGRDHSLTKLMRLEEMCSTMINMESIEGFGEMETGVLTSGDGGTDAESEGQESAPKASTSSRGSRARQEGTAPSTSRATPTPRVQHRPAVQATPTQKETTPADDTAPMESSTPAEAEGDGMQSVATSSIGEVAAIAHLSDVEGQAEEFVDLENIHVENDVQQHLEEQVREARQELERERDKQEERAKE
ncbi:myb-related transcription factor, partner of profilin-like [Ambystoma mexicanum]|uniref:myb-related transcription factor, partner of profilin-like n=1 Tax=Ambystoma mexicanum TaxID=8296 RepID=UPI0037E8B28E